MISIIIPVLNEEKNIGKLQENLRSLNGEYEVIFCDGGSTDRTVECIESDFRVVKSRCGRGYQMNKAAAVARGNILFFIHCDVKLEKNVLEKIPESVLKGERIGYLKIRFDSDHILMRICGFMSDQRARIRKIIYGDQGIVIHKDLFEKIGKIPEHPLMEDLEFSLRVKKRNIPWIQLPCGILVSARRFEKNGMLKTMWQMQVMQIKYLFGNNLDRFVEKYEDIR